MSDQTDRRLAESVAYFLYWSGYLEVEAREIVIIVEPGTGLQVGTETFRHLKDALDEAHPNWREWSCCYSPGPPATTNR
jgi:hypothetical protein